MTKVKIIIISENTDQKTELEIDHEIAYMSETIKNMLESAEGENIDIPISNIDEKTLQLVFKFCEKYVNYGEDDDQDDEWDEQQFKEMNAEQLLEFVSAVNFLEIIRLLKASCKRIADIIRETPTTEELREYFNIENDYTPELMEEFNKENEALVSSD